MNQEKSIPKWLKQTQHNSWEPEVFISGIVLFGLFQIPDLLEEFRYYFYTEIYGITGEIDNVVAILTTGVQWMIAGLILHLFFRGIWIGLVGLSYVFPDGIRHDRLNYKGKFNNKITLIPDFTNQIIRLEKISSSIFSITYLIFMSIISAYLYIFISIVVPVYGFLIFTDFTAADLIYNNNIQGVFNIYTGLMLAIGIIYFIDFFTLGGLKRIKFLNKTYYPIYVFMSAITLSSLYRHIYYLLISNFKWWKVSIFITAFVAISLFLISANVDPASSGDQLSQLTLFDSGGDHYASPDYYDDQQQTHKLRASIQSDIISNDVLKVFISSRVSFEDSIRVNCQEMDLSKTDQMLSCIEKFYVLTLDDSLQVETPFIFTRHEETNSKGIMTYIDITDLSRGNHKLEITLQNWFYEDYASIPFYRE